MTKLTAEDIEIGMAGQAECNDFNSTNNVLIINVGENNPEKAEALKQQILSDHEDAKVYDSILEKYQAPVFETIAVLESEIKQLKEENKQLAGQIIGDEAYVLQLEQDSKANAEKLVKFSNMIYHAECGRLPENWIKESKKILGGSNHGN